MKLSGIVKNISIYTWILLAACILSFLIPMIYCNQISMDYALRNDWLSPDDVVGWSKWFLFFAPFICFVLMLVEVYRKKYHGAKVCILSCGVSIVLPVLLPCCPGHSRVACAQNLKAIGLALLQYSMDNNEYFPPESGIAGLQRLRHYIDDEKVFICPDSEDVPAGKGVVLGEKNVSYVYVGGLRYNTSGEVPLMYEKLNHQNFGNVLFSDGHVAGYSGSNWKDKMREESNKPEK